MDVPDTFQFARSGTDGSASIANATSTVRHARAGGLAVFERQAFDVRLGRSRSRHHAGALLVVATLNGLGPIGRFL